MPLGEVLAGLSALVTIWVFFEGWEPEVRPGPPEGPAAVEALPVVPEGVLVPSPTPSVEEVVICQVVVRGPGRDPEGEEIVLCNEGAAAVDLGGWVLEDNAGRYTVPRGTLVGAGDRWSVEGVTFNPSGHTGGLHLNDGGDFVSLRAPNGRVVDTCSWPPKAGSPTCTKTWL